MEYPSLCEINCGEGGVDLNEEGDRPHFPSAWCWI
jgi:hypothetical protein